MNKYPLTRIALVALGALALSLSPALAAKKREEPAPVAQLSEAGVKLEARYAAMLNALQQEIAKALPNVDAQTKESFLGTYQAESAATIAERKIMHGMRKAKDKDAAAKAHESEKQALAEAKEKAGSQAGALLQSLDSFLSSDKLDAKLVKCAVLAEAAPRGLAEFAQESAENEKLVEKLLADEGLMKQMLMADGPVGGRYGQAMKIYTDILKASPKAGEGVLQKLALGTSLEHAVPLKQRNPDAVTDGPATVDPVKRYQHFEKAYLAGELDPGFKDLTAWDFRFVGNGDEPDEMLAWGREMLRNYRPDQIQTDDYRWRYVESVKTDVKYGSQDQKNDDPSLGFYQNIINTGGVCGRRAFFGRFILRAFGIPTLARPQPGHATLVHWTPVGWVINLGASWGWGTVDGAADTDFLAMTQARKVEATYPEVKRAQWIGTALGETKTAGFGSPAGGFWNAVALYRQRAIVDKANAVTLAAVGTDIGEANESKEKEHVKQIEIPEAEKKIVVGANGAITIPAVACVKPVNSSAKIRLMKSHGGGMQLHYSRNGTAEDFEYVFDAPAAGKYTLDAMVVTTSPAQHLLVTANNSTEPLHITAPYTIGKWERTPPVEITLVKGKNQLRFSRPDPVKGLTIKEFTLKPVK